MDDWNWKASCDAVEELMRRALDAVMRAEGLDPQQPEARSGFVVSIQYQANDRRPVLVNVANVRDETVGNFGESGTLHGAFRVLGSKLKEGGR